MGKPEEKKSEYSFDELSEEEKLEKQHEIARQAAFEKVSASARTCLNSGLFVKYKNDYKEFEEKTITAFINLDPGADKYKEYCIALSMELSVLRKLKDFIEKDR